VFSEAYYRKALADLKKQGISREQTCLEKVSIKMVEDFKGIPMPVSFRYIDV